MKAYTGADVEGLYTLGTVVVDYRGYRVTAQSIIPGLTYLLLTHSIFSLANPFSRYSVLGRCLKGNFGNSYGSTFYGHDTFPVTQLTLSKHSKDN